MQIVWNKRRMNEGGKFWLDYVKVCWFKLEYKRDDGIPIRLKGMWWDWLTWVVSAEAIEGILIKETNYKRKKGQVIRKRGKDNQAYKKRDLSKVQCYKCDKFSHTQILSRKEENSSCPSRSERWKLSILLSPIKWAKYQQKYVDNRQWSISPHNWIQRQIWIFWKSLC